MHGLVQYEPLLLSSIVEHAAVCFADVEVVSWEGSQPFRYDYGRAERRARHLAGALRARGITQGDFIGSLAWMNHRHFELFYAAPGIGAILHAANPRLSAEQIAFTINKAGETILFVDPECIPTLKAMLPHLERIETVVIMDEHVPEGDFPGISNVIAYEDLVASGEDGFIWPTMDERSASTLNFTSGTSGEPKGVLYSHRGSYLSTLSIAAPNCWDAGHEDTILAIAPFCHCNAWGAAYLAPMVGAKLVLPGRSFDGASIHRMICAEGVTVASAVPTVWLGVLQHCADNGLDLGSLNRIVCGGAAPPATMMATLAKDYGVRTLQVWGMTETTHAAAMRRTGSDVESPDWASAPQGRPTFGTRLRIVDEDGRPLPRDGEARGHLQVRANWCASQYLGLDDVELCDREGWLNTGDVATLSQRGLRITDRIKDVIKSGGEWVSSIDLENVALAHPAISQAAVIGVAHPRWQERPIMIVVAKDNVNPDCAELRAFLIERVPKLWVPDRILLVDELPHTSTGKVHKRILKERYKDILMTDNAPDSG